MTDVFVSYLRHGRRFGVDPEFWQTAASDLDHGQLQRLAAELDAKLPTKWANSQNRPSEAAPQAGSAANKSRSEPVALTPVVSSASGTCALCPKALPPMNKTGLCRGCYQRELMRQRRAA